MIDGLRLLQGVVTPTQFNRIADWNMERNNLDLNSKLEIEMIMEEVKEYYEADTFIDRLDAVADIIFVAVGTYTKATKNFHLVQDNYLAPLEMVLTDFVGRYEVEGINVEITAVITEVLNIVIDANERKGTNKDENGKIIKPDDFISPEDTISDYIDYLRTFEEDGKEDVDAMLEAS